jgi:short-subunit dehydrogenase
MHVIVTGASSGIGRDLAKAFGIAGNTISLVARRRSLLEALQGEIDAPSEVIAADLGDAADPIGWLLEAEKRAGPVDVLINNAGISYIEPTPGIDAGRIAALFQINVHTPIAAVQHVLPPMLERGAGTIINIASVAAFTAAPNMCHYHATKGALGNFSESLHMELSQSGVHVLTVYPGPIDTPMAQRNYEQFSDSAAARRAPAGDTATLARLVNRAVANKQARVIYPRFYRIAWWFPGIARFVSARAVPGVVGNKTPPMPGDLTGQREIGED